MLRLRFDLDIRVRELLDRNQIHSRIFATTIDFDFEFETVAFIEIGHSGTFNR